MKFLVIIITTTTTTIKTHKIRSYSPEPRTEVYCFSLNSDWSEFGYIAIGLLMNEEWFTKKQTSISTHNSLKSDEKLKRYFLVLIVASNA